MEYTIEPNPNIILVEESIEEDKTIDKYLILRTRENEQIQFEIISSKYDNELDFILYEVEKEKFMYLSDYQKEPKFRVVRSVIKIIDGE